MKNERAPFIRKVAREKGWPFSQGWRKRQLTVREETQVQALLLGVTAPPR